MSEPRESGIIGKIEEDGLPVVIRFVDEYPDSEVRALFSWLTVVSWKYDGHDQNGMPSKDVNERMAALEHAIDSLEDDGLCRHAYSRTGNNLKELVYYIADRDEFMSAFNDALLAHPRYPVEINFYEDSQWQDLQRILALFRPED